MNKFVFGLVLIAIDAALVYFYKSQSVLGLVGAFYIGGGLTEMDYIESQNDNRTS